jgi:hypothetical protein
MGNKVFKKIPWKPLFLEKSSLETTFLGMTFLGKRFPCYVVSPKKSCSYQTLSILSNLFHEASIIYCKRETN